VFDHPGLRVSAASPEHLLAMKVLAARRRDAEDIRFLVKHLNLATVEEALRLCAEIFPDEEVPERATRRPGENPQPGMTRRAAPPSGTHGRGFATAYFTT